MKNAPFFKIKSGTDAFPLAMKRAARVRKIPISCFARPGSKGRRIVVKTPFRFCESRLKKKPKIDWLVTLSSTRIALERMKETVRVMDRVIGRDARPDLLYNGEFLWPRPTLLTGPSASTAIDPPAFAPGGLVRYPGHAWMKSKAPAKAAMEMAADLDPSNGDRAEKLIRLSGVAGAW